MNKLAKIITDYGIIFIESSSSEKISEYPDTISEHLESSVQGGSGIITDRLNNLIRIVKPLSESILESVRNISKEPNSISVEFGLGVNVEGNFFVVKTSGEGSLKVTYNWNNHNNNQISAD